MVKTTPLNDDVHMRLKEGQMLLFKAYDIKMSIPNMLSYIVGSPEEISKKIAKLRVLEHQDAVSDDIVTKRDESEDSSTKKLKPSGVILIEEEHVNV